MKKKIIIACILLILGAGAVCLAFCAKPGAVRPDIEGITEASVGQRIRFSIDGAEYMPVDDTDGIYIQETEEKGDPAPNGIEKNDEGITGNGN